MIRRTGLMLLFFAVLTLAAIMAGWWPSLGSEAGPAAGERGVLPLVRPAFAQQGSFLDQEAGMAAYVKVQGPINLANARRAFKIVEAEESDFLVRFFKSIALAFLESVPFE